MPETLQSFCVVCDSPSSCGHNAARYLEPITYERGPAHGWIVPERERERWRAPIRRPEPPKAQTEPLELTELVPLLEKALYVDEHLFAELENAYEANPRRLNWITTEILQGVATGRIRNPGGLLRTLLRET